MDKPGGGFVWREEGRICVDTAAASGQSGTATINLDHPACRGIADILVRGAIRRQAAMRAQEAAASSTAPKGA